MAAVKQFYENDAISRISPNVKDTRLIKNPATGEKEAFQIRHLMYTLREAYGMFLMEYNAPTGE